MILLYFFFWNRDDSAEAKETLTQTLLQPPTLRETRSTPWTKTLTIQVDTLVTRGVLFLLEFPSIHHVCTNHRHPANCFCCLLESCECTWTEYCHAQCPATRDERRMTDCMYRKRSHYSQGAEMILTPCCEGSSVTSIDQVA